MAKKKAEKKPKEEKPKEKPEKKPKAEEKPKAEKPEAEPEEDEDFKHMVRLVGQDLRGGKPVHLALTEIAGVGRPMARAVAYAASVDPTVRIGELDDAQVAKLGEVLGDPGAHGFPVWMLNRRNDFDTGKDLHLIGGSIEMAFRSDIGRERQIRSYHGIRHERGLRVRGQRTRTTGRSGMTVGVKRKEIRMKEAAASASKKGKKKEG